MLFMMLGGISTQLCEIFSQTRWMTWKMDRSGAERIRGGHWAMTATSDRAARLRRSLKRLGFDLKPAERRGRFYITQDGAEIEESRELFDGMDLASIERSGEHAGGTQQM